ncbi:hypothetical protein NY08_1442 [Rhodococcus sp. B7740]|nr:hypothetical protein NY08_1442 [Rhodococcus sp. B7740]
MIFKFYHPFSFSRKELQAFRDVSNRRISVQKFDGFSSE